MRLLLAGALATLTAAGLAAIRPALLTDEERAAASTIRENRMRADVRFLSSDLLEGRGPATRGDRLAREYLASRFEAIGLEPGAPGGWLGAGIRPRRRDRRLSRGAALLERHGRHGPALPRGLRRVLGRAGTAKPALTTPRSCSSATASWPRSRAGTTTRAPTSGPRPARDEQRPGGDPRAFAGKRRLYYGRWDYKFEMAARLGAAGAIIVHTDASAGYGWKVVQSSWTGEQLSLPAVPGEPTLPVKAWATEEACRRIARLGGHDLDALRAAAERRDFHPVPLGVRLSLALRNEVSRRPSANVIGRLPGRDPVLSRRGGRLQRAPRPPRREARPGGRARRVQRRPRQRLRARHDAGGRARRSSRCPSGRAARSSSRRWRRRSRACSALRTSRATRRCPRGGSRRTSTSTA